MGRDTGHRQRTGTGDGHIAMNASTADMRNNGTLRAYFHVAQINSTCIDSPMSADFLQINEFYGIFDHIRTLNMASVPAESPMGSRFARALKIPPREPDQSSRTKIREAKTADTGRVTTQA
ncbi:MAG: hypothetical protein AB2707_21095, partial [Candidatus Thiodiazotropha sp.]